MDGKKEHNNPLKTFKEQDDLVVPSKQLPAAADRLASIRHSEVTSTVPDDINWNNIYLGKRHGLHSIKHEEGPRKRGLV
jgi:hypothetical protein